MTEQDNSLAKARVWQTLVCFGMLAAIGLSAFALEAVVHSEAFGAWLDRKKFAANDVPMAYERQFLDTNDRLTLQEIPDLDPSSGGVYFFGASNLMWGMAVPDLPPDERRLVHNFGVGVGSPYYNRQFAQYLIRHKNILAAGPQKTLIVFATSFHIGKPARADTSTYFSNLWQRYGIYHYDFHQGIEPVVRGPVWGAYNLERARCSSVVQTLMTRAALLPVPRALRKRQNEKDPAVIVARYYEAKSAADWEERVRQHRRELQDWLDDLRAQGVAFQIVLLPVGSWYRGLPFPASYRAMIDEFCAANHVPLTDYTKLLTDDEFVDYSHVNSLGLRKQDAVLMDVARKFLQARGVWPAKAAVPETIR